MKKILKKAYLLPLFIIALVNFSQYWPFYLKSLLPFPGDLLVSFFFPWNGGGFVGYNSWTVHKEYIASDTLRALYPWKLLVISQLSKWQWPLWNPYNFSGSPLLANLQSSVFFPGNLFYVVLPPLWAWTIQVVLLLSIFGVFTYFFLRSQKLSFWGAIFGAIAVSNITYLLNWHELLVITQSVLFLPLALWSINKFSQTKKFFYLILISIFLAFSLFGGHAQTVLYVYLLIFLFLLNRKISLKSIIFVFGLGLLLGSIQLLPALELYLNSARELDATQVLFAKQLFPWKNLVTVFAPDFFGNPVTGNFWGWDYHNSLIYLGIVALIFFVMSFFSRIRHQDYKFFLIIGVGAIFLSTNPFAFLLEILKIPVFSTGIPARTIFVAQFCFCILAAYGFDHFATGKNSKLKNTFIPLAILAIIYVILWIFTSKSHDPNLLISRKNLIFPSLIFISGAVIIFLVQFYPKLLKLGAILLILLGIIEYARYFNKIEPFAPKEFVFPSHPVISYLQKNAGINRFTSSKVAIVSSNIATYYHLFDPQGYDPLHLERYGEILASSENGKIPLTIQKSDAVLTQNDSIYKERLLDILGTKYFIDKNDLYKSDWEPQEAIYSPLLYQLIWQKSKWKIYERKTALPRIFFTQGYEVISDKNRAIGRFYDPNFDYRKKLILESDPHLKTNNSSNNSPSFEILEYSPNRIILETVSSNANLLFLSDAYYPGWKAQINGEEGTIIPADLAFRAVVVPKGKSRIIFTYQPLSFAVGVALTTIGIFLIGWLILKSNFFKKKIY